MTEEKEPGDVAQSKAQTKTTSGDTTGVYPNATGITEIAMGVTDSRPIPRRECPKMDSLHPGCIL